MQSNKLFLKAKNDIYQLSDIYKSLFLFLFFILLYSLIQLFRMKMGLVNSDCVADECEYFRLADNILNGIDYSTNPNTNPELKYGPGYPLFVAFLKLFSINRQGIIFVNLLLSSFTIGIIYLTSKLLFKSTISIILASIWGFYFIHYPTTFTANSETLTSFIFLLSFYLFILYERTNKRSLFIVSGILFGYLVLIKVIFSYVLLFLLIINSINFVLNKKIKIFFLFSLIAMLTTLPYQIYILSDIILRSQERA